MNFGVIAIKALVIIVLLFLLSLVGAVTFPSLATITGSTGTGLSTLLFLILAILILSVVGNLIGRGIRSVKRPLEALFLAFVGAFFLGAALALFAVLKVPNSVSINLYWLGAIWYDQLLTLLFIGAPLMLVFMVAE